MDATKGAMYETYVRWCEGSGVPKIARTTFYELWKSNFGHVKIPAQSRFKKCTT
jgi:hypothetical protein